MAEQCAVCMFILHIIYSTEQGKHHLSYRSFILQIIYSTDHLSYRSFILQSGGNIIYSTDHLSYRSFFLQIIHSTERGKHHLSITSFVHHIICPTDHLFYRSFILQSRGNIICPTHHLSYRPFILQIIYPTNHLFYKNFDLPMQWWFFNYKITVSFFVFCFYFNSVKNMIFIKMRNCLRIDIDMNLSDCLKIRIYSKNMTWTEMLYLFQNRDMFENERQYYWILILTPYFWFKVGNFCFNI